MNEQLKQIKKRLKQENRLGSEAQDTTEGTDALADTGEQEPESAIDRERKAILSTGRRFVRPLTMNPQRALKVTGAIIAGLVAAVIIGFAVWIYHYQGEGDTVYQASRIIPYPAACVGGSSQWLPYPHPCAGGEMIGYDQYLFELRTLKQRQQNPIGGGEGVDFSTEEGRKQLENLRILALGRTQQKSIIRQIADEQDIELSEDKVRKKIEKFKQKGGGEQQLKESLQQVYGWDLNDFRSEVRSQMLQQEILRRQAEDIMEQAKSGDTDFADLVARHSEGQSGRSSGEVGYVTDKSQFPEKFKQVALGLEKDEVSQPVRTQSGFHILKATDIHPQKGTRISHILINSAQLQQKASQRLEKADKESYIGVPMNTESVRGGPTPDSSDESGQDDSG